jgi:hypothetical protein
MAGLQDPETGRGTMLAGPSSSFFAVLQRNTRLDLVTQDENRASAGVW